VESKKNNIVFNFFTGMKPAFATKRQSNLPTCHGKKESIKFLVEKTIYNHYSHIERKNQSITQLKLLKIVKFYIVRAHGQMLL